MTDSCFAPDTGSFSPAERTGLVRIPGEAVGPEQFARLPAQSENKPFVLEDLFLNHKGVLSLNSSSKGEYAVATVFIEALDELLEGYPSYSPPLSWKQFVSQLDDRVARRFKNTYPGLETEFKTRVDARNQKTQTVHVFKDKKTQEPLLPVPERLEFDLRKGGVADTKEEDARPASQPAVPATPEERAVGSAPPSPYPAPAHITVHCPPGTLIFFDDRPTRQTDIVRLYRTPPLTPGRIGTYALRAERMVDGQKVVETQPVQVQAGKDVVVKLRSLTPTTAVTNR